MDNYFLAAKYAFPTQDEKSVSRLQEDTVFSEKDSRSN